MYMALHNEAGRILSLLQNKKGSLKNLVFSSKYKNKKKLNALVSETIKYTPVLNEIIEKSSIRLNESLLKDIYFCQVIVYEFLFGGKDELPKNIQAILTKKSVALNSQLKLLKAKEKVEENHELLSKYKEDDTKIKLPRYVRVNTLQTTVDEVISHFQKNGMVLVRNIHTNYEEYIRDVTNLKSNEFMVDMTLKDVLVFQHGTSFYGHILYKQGDIILQDKASCLAASALAPPPGSKVIDSCAAPGNKTSYLAAMMQNKGKIYAFDRDPQRFSTMQTLLLKAGVLCVECQNVDFLTVNKNNDNDGSSTYDDVEYMLVDPSCSGSGIVERLDYNDHNNNNNLDVENNVTITNNPSTTNQQLINRLKSLSNFQCMLLNHSMNNFPNVRRIVYSTCSVHRQENEEVVLEVLKKNKHFKLVRIFSEIPSRGSAGRFNNENLGEISNNNNLGKISNNNNLGEISKNEGGLHEDKMNCENSSNTLESEKIGKKKKRKMKGKSVLLNEQDEDVDLEKCLRLSPNKDLTNGFFVACFERKFDVPLQKTHQLQHEIQQLNVSKLAKQQLGFKNSLKESIKNESEESLTKNNNNMQQNKRKQESYFEEKKKKRKKKKLQKIDTNLNTKLDTNLDATHVVTNVDTKIETKMDTNELQDELNEHNKTLINAQNNERQNNNRDIIYNNSSIEKHLVIKKKRKLLKKRCRRKHKIPVVLLDKKSNKPS